MKIPSPNLFPALTLALGALDVQPATARAPMVAAAAAGQCQHTTAVPGVVAKRDRVRGPQLARLEKA